MSLHIEETNSEDDLDCSDTIGEGSTRDTSKFRGRYDDSFFEAAIEVMDIIRETRDGLDIPVFDGWNFSIHDVCEFLTPYRY